MLQRGWGWIETGWRGAMELVGPDRFRFLNGLVTCDVSGLELGAGAYGYFTSLQGRILADVAVLSLADRFFLDLPAAAVGTIEQHLSKYLLADRVEIGLTTKVGSRVVGPECESQLAALFGDLPEEAWHARETKAGSLLVRRRCPGPASFDLLAATEEDLEKLRHSEAGQLSPEAYEAYRVELGQPRWGIDFGPETLPQEVGDTAAVSYEKGCYLGQEVVARIHYRGGVQKSLVGVLLPSTGEALPGRTLQAQGRDAGRITSSVYSPGLGRWIGLAMLHNRAGGAGTELEVEGGGRAQVSTLPFVQSASGGVAS